MNIISSDKELQALLKKIITTGAVSVFCDPDGIEKEYSIITHEGIMMTCTCTQTANNRNMPACEYSIELNEVPVSKVVIPNKRTIYLPEEQSILDLFKMCSDKLIWQEQQIKLQNLLGGMKQKRYMA